MMSKLALAAVSALVPLGLLVPAATAGAATAGAVVPATPQPLHVVVPAYWFQNIPSWSGLAADDPVSSHDGQLTVTNAILNPCAPNGKTCSPGGAVNPVTQQNLAQEEAAGITFYGYVATGYANGSVTIAKAEKEMREYRRQPVPVHRDRVQRGRHFGAEQHAGHRRV